jgi:putative addiction module killer protein
MKTIRPTPAFDAWLHGLKDVQAKARIVRWVNRLAGGNRGDARYLREGVSELREDYGPGYRVYYAEQGEVVVILLAGGTKKSQGSDIETAIAMLRDIQEVR